MSINKLALIRYKIIDNCLRNSMRKWTLENLVEACSEALYDYEGITKGVSMRTVQSDIQTMRSNKLGYNAPIIIVDKKFYTYEDKHYSITNIPLSKQDVDTLSEVVDILQQFKGFQYFEELNDILKRLEDKVYKQKHKGKSYIQFETNVLLKGLSFIDPLHKAILQKQVVAIQYQSFKAILANEIIFHPYLLKEYRNRWFVLGRKVQAPLNSPKGGRFKKASQPKEHIIILALDRIQSVEHLSTEDYIKNDIIDLDHFFDDTIGVTKTLNQKPHTIVLKIDNESAPYILTKSLHTSQKILRHNDEGLIFSIDVIWNFELEREILGFGEAMQALAPKRLVNKITTIIKKMQLSY